MGAVAGVTPGELRSDPDVSRRRGWLRAVARARRIGISVCVLAAVVIALASTAGGATSKRPAPPTLTERFPLTPTATTPPLTATAAAPTSTAPTTATATGSSTATSSPGASKTGGLSLAWLLVPLVVVALVGTVIVRRRSGGAPAGASQPLRDTPSPPVDQSRSDSSLGATGVRNAGRRAGRAG